MQLKIYQNKETLASELANWMSELISATLREQQYFTIALSGGETPKALYKQLALFYRDKIDWNRIHFFWGDERVVPCNDERNNAKMAQQFLLDYLPVPSTQIHRMRTDIEPVFAAKEYEKVLHYFFDHTSKSFDLVLLGMGDDGHTLSLFPNSLLVEQPTEKWVSSIYNVDQQMYRITLTPTIVNRAGNIAFMIDGPKKSHVLSKVISGDYLPELLPAQIIKPVHGELYWFVDEEAAKELTSSIHHR